MAQPAWHVTLHARPPGEFPAEARVLDGHELAALAIPPQLLALPLPISFEEAYSALQSLPRMFIEPDGSWVWVSSDPEQPWQLDGMLYDRGGKLLYVELKGHAPEDVLAQVCEHFGCTPPDCVVQFVRHAVVVSLEEWWRWSSQRSPARNSR